MPRKGHSEEKIVYALRQVEAGKKVTEVCPEMGVSPQAFYSWKRRYAGVGLNELVLTHYKRAAPFRVGFECRLRTEGREHNKWITESTLAWTCIRPAFRLQSGTAPGS
jgi:hypothetical protein